MREYKVETDEQMAEELSSGNEDKKLFFYETCQVP